MAPTIDSILNLSSSLHNFCFCKTLKISLLCVCVYPKMQYVMGFVVIQFVQKDLRCMHSKFNFDFLRVTFISLNLFVSNEGKNKTHQFDSLHKSYKCTDYSLLYTFFVFLYANLPIFLCFFAEDHSLFFCCITDTKRHIHTHFKN